MTMEPSEEEVNLLSHSAQVCDCIDSDELKNFKKPVRSEDTEEEEDEDEDDDDDDEEGGDSDDDLRNSFPPGHSTVSHSTMPWLKHINEEINEVKNAARASIG
jgi:hypothetical protein